MILDVVATTCLRGRSQLRGPFTIPRDTCVCLSCSSYYSIIIICPRLSEYERKPFVLKVACVMLMSAKLNGNDDWIWPNDGRWRFGGDIDIVMVTIGMSETPCEDVCFMRSLCFVCSMYAFLLHQTELRCFVSLTRSRGDSLLRYRRDGQHLISRASHLLSLFTTAQCVPYGLDLRLVQRQMLIDGYTWFGFLCVHACECAIPETCDMPLRI
jgi:hypothetical protein